MAGSTADRQPLQSLRAYSRPLSAVQRCSSPSLCVTQVNDYVKVWMNSAKSNPYVYYTPKYLAMAQPASLLQHTANAAFYTLLASKRVLSSKSTMLYNCWARNQIGYMLGDSGHSYVTGYGAGAPLKTPHKAASCPPPDVGDCTAEVRRHGSSIADRVGYGGLAPRPQLGCRLGCLGRVRLFLE